MFNYTNTVLLNSNLDSSGIAKWVAGTNTLTVNRVLKFLKPNVETIYKRAAADAVKSKVTFTPTNGGASVYRLSLYMGLTNNNNSYYSNDMVFKGKPLVFEFSVAAGDNAATISASAVAAVNKVQSLFGDNYITAAIGMTTGETPAPDGTFTITGTDEYQVFKVAKIERFDPTVGSALKGGEFVASVSGVITNGTPGFGTYSLMIKDYRLPTMEAVRFGGINQEELPIVGAKYNQYTISYLKDRGNMGSSVVGNAVQSRTTHVFFVNTSIASDFETALANIGTITTIA